jgi:hypothetical protein
MYSSISKHDGVNYSRKLSDLRKINPNPTPVSHDSISHEQVLSSTDSSSFGSSKKVMVAAAGVILLTGFFVGRHILKKKKPQVSADPRGPRSKSKPQWVIQLFVLLGIGAIAGGTWMILKKSGKYDL